MATETPTPVQLTGQERLDLRISRAFPRLVGRVHRPILRLGRGRVAASKRGIPIGLLTTTGAKTGKHRAVPLMYYQDDDRYLVVASNGGLDRHPAWFHNLQAHREATFSVHGESRPVRARVVSATERDGLWPMLVRHNPLWAGFQQLTSRQTPVVALEPREL